MGNINNISIDGKDVRNDLLQHAKLIKIVKSDKLLVDHLYLVINQTDYKGPLPQEKSIVELTTVHGQSEVYIDRFYIHKDDNIFSSDQLTEREKAIAQEHGNVLFHGLSVNSDFLFMYKEVEKIMFSPPQHVFKNQTLTEVLEYIKTVLGLTNLIISHQSADYQITYFAPNKVCKLQDNTYTKTPLQELADIFYAVANVRDNTLYFIKKRYSTRELRHALYLSPEQVKRKELIRGDFADYNGVEYSYFERSTNNIKHIYSEISPFLKLDNVYEHNLAYTYVKSKYSEIEEKQLLSLTISGVQNRSPGCYLQIRKSKALGTSDKGIADILGGHSVKECVITYEDQQERKYDPKEAGPSSKKAKLEASWSTYLKLVRINR